MADGAKNDRFKSVGPYVPFPLWLAASSIWLVPYKMHLLSTLGENVPVPAFPELSTYMDDLPAMLSPWWWVAAHILTVSAFMLCAMCYGLALRTGSAKQPRQIALWYLHLVHSGLVLSQYNKLNTAVPPWIATVINVGGIFVLFWVIPASWKSDLPVDTSSSVTTRPFTAAGVSIRSEVIDTERERAAISAYLTKSKTQADTLRHSLEVTQPWATWQARWRSLPGNATVYWAVFGIPWWLELALILRHIPSTSVPLAVYLGIWGLLDRVYFNRLHSHGQIFDD
jgi:hypothetical protein